MSKTKTLKSLGGLIAHFSLTAFFEYLFIHKILGYPLIPALTTNDWWALTQLKVEMTVWMVVALIPSVLLATLVLSLIWVCINMGLALPYVYAIITEEETNE